MVNAVVSGPKAQPARHHLHDIVVQIWKFKVSKDVILDTPWANMNNVKFEFNDFNDFSIGMPPVARQLVVTVIYWPRVEIFHTNEVWIWLYNI